MYYVCIPIPIYLIFMLPAMIIITQEIMYRFLQCCRILVGIVIIIIYDHSLGIM